MWWRCSIIHQLYNYGSKTLALTLWQQLWQSAGSWLGQEHTWITCISIYTHIHCLIHTAHVGVAARTRCIMACVLHTPRSRSRRLHIFILRMRKYAFAHGSLPHARATLHAARRRSHAHKRARLVWINGRCVCTRPSDWGYKSRASSPQLNNRSFRQTTNNKSSDSY